MRRLRGALIGFGAVAENAHLPGFAAFRDGAAVELAAVVDASPERLERARRRLPAARTYASPESLFSAEPGLDFVDIATPPFCHAAQAQAALERGLHVLCEKPLALEPRRLADLRRVAERAGRALFCVHNWAHAPQWVKALALARGGSVGRIEKVDLSVRRTRPAASALPGDWRKDPALAGGGILVDHGWHALYLVHKILGGDARIETSSLLKSQSGGADEESSLRLQYKNAAASLFFTWRADTRSNVAAIVGSRGRIDLADDRLFLRSSGRAEERFDFVEALSAGSAHPDWFAATLKEFLEAVDEPAGAGTNQSEAEFCCRIISEAYAAASTEAAA